MVRRGVVKLLVLWVLLGFGCSVWASDCKKLVVKVRSASEIVLGISYPWWYNVGQMEVESGCIWRTSLDGWGSIGYAQITPVFWDRVLRRLFPGWRVKDSTDYFLAHAYVVKDCLKSAYCKKNLWNVYQCYNRSCGKVNREAREGSCIWERAFSVCNEKYAESICVWRVNGSCKQWRMSCDINYSYGFKVWRAGKKYDPGVVEREWRYW